MWERFHVTFEQFDATSVGNSRYPLKASAVPADESDRPPLTAFGSALHPRTARFGGHMPPSARRQKSRIFTDRKQLGHLGVQVPVGVGNNPYQQPATPCGMEPLPELALL